MLKMCVVCGFSCLVNGRGRVWRIKWLFGGFYGDWKLFLKSRPLKTMFAEKNQPVTRIQTSHIFMRYLFQSKLPFTVNMARSMVISFALLNEHSFKTHIHSKPLFPMLTKCKHSNTNINC